jgi:hypothetical protein
MKEPELEYLAANTSGKFNAALVIWLPLMLMVLRKKPVIVAFPLLSIARPVGDSPSGPVNDFDQMWVPLDENFTKKTSVSGEPLELKLAGELGVLRTPPPKLTLHVK